MKNHEVMLVDEDRVPCDGPSKTAGHPRIFLSLEEGGAVCPYCSKTFKRRQTPPRDTVKKPTKKP